MEEVYNFTGEEITNLMNGVYLDIGKYKITCGTLDGENVISLTSEDIEKMRLGEEVRYENMLFTYKYESNEIYEEFKDNILYIRELHKKNIDINIYEIADAVQKLQRALEEAKDGDEYSEDQIMYIFEVARKNILYLQNKLDKIPNKEPNLYTTISQRIKELKKSQN